MIMQTTGRQRLLCWSNAIMVFCWITPALISASGPVRPRAERHRPSNSQPFCVTAKSLSNAHKLHMSHTPS
ncbi:hypothetical protein IWX92DRAFT_367069 [Phyllosticta citricarpa]